MRCPTCDYSLWRIEGRTCPECGSVFKPSDFEFRPSAVAFHCPHCQQVYFGTSPKGHLEPSQFQCVTCHRPISMDEMVLEPAPGVAPDEAGRPPNPWSERQRTGYWTAWWRSVRGVLFSPSNIGASIPREGPIGDAVHFMCVTIFLTTVVGFFVGLAFAMLPIFLLSASGQGTGLTFGMIVVQQLIGAVAGPLFTIAIIFVVALISHGCLRITGGATGGVGLTIRTTCFLQGGVGALNLAIVVPCVNLFVGLAIVVWWLASGTLMLRTAHRTTTGRALFAIAAPVIPPLIIMMALAAWLFVMITGAAGRAGAAIPTTTTANALQAYEARHGAWPKTPLDAVADGTFTGLELLELVGDESDALRLGGLGRDDIALGGQDVLTRGGAALAAALPASGPYRIGQAVFCWDGVQSSSRHAWLVIAERGSPQSPYYEVEVLDGPPSVFADQAAFEAARVAENRRRSAVGEPEIPPLSDIPSISTRP